MARINWRDYVNIDKDLHHGEPCIKGTRVPASIIVGSIADGMTVDEVLREYPQITLEAVRASLASGVMRKSALKRHINCCR